MRLIFFWLFMILLSEKSSKLAFLGIYFRMSLFAFSIAPFCQEQYESAKYTLPLSPPPLRLPPQCFSLFYHENRCTSIWTLHFKSILSQKYGNPVECTEEFQDYSEDDFSKLLLNLQSPADIRLPRTC